MILARIEAKLKRVSKINWLLNLLRTGSKVKTKCFKAFFQPDLFDWDYILLQCY